MTQEQIHILELLSSEDNANVQLGLELLQSQNITIPILEKFSNSIAKLNLLTRKAASKHTHNIQKSTSHNEKMKSLFILEGVLTLGEKQFALNCLFMDNISEEVLHRVGNIPHLASKYFINFSKEEENA